MKRKFLCLIEWSFDHSNTEIVTFTIEGDIEEEHNQDSPLYIGRPLTTETFKGYYSKHEYKIDEVIKTACEAVDGNPMARCARAVTLHEIYGYSSYEPKLFEGHKVVVLEVRSQELCSFENGKIIFN
ncbi:MAG TPA: hypothetical protein PKY08_01260 [Candidatus Magasanikbacteria bacterium]|nr:hypothetical protein [Candidatus Magasanikbacteria bacterium]